MNTLPVPKNLRVLVIDDNRAIHQDFRKILGGRHVALETEKIEADLFGKPIATPRAAPFELGFASQGEEGLALMDQAAQEDRPYAVAFVDVRMPPGWDGVETIERIWRKHPALEVVICTAYADYSWDEISARLGSSDRLLILKKPFDNIEVLQLATALTEKWRLHQQAGCRLADMERLVAERTSGLRAANELVEKANGLLRKEITERREAEAAARLWQRRYDLISSASRQVVYDYDRHSGVVDWSGSVDQVLGLSARQLGQGVGQWTDLIHEDDRAEAMRLLAEAELGEKACERIYRFRCGNGEYRWIHDRSIVLDAGPQQTGRRLGVMEDISARRWAEQRIREQAGLLNKTRDAILVCDLDYCIHYWNRGAERLYGWSGDEANRQKVPDLLHRETPELFREACAATIAVGAWTGELAPARKDGRPVMVESRWTLLRDDAGTPTSLLMVDTDVTERKQLEGRFLRAQRLESIGFLASGIAHDLNNVFTPILMAGELLQTKVGNPRVEPLFASLLNSAKRGAGLVRQVLTFARGADGERSILKLPTLLKEIDALIRDTFPRAIELRSEFAEPLHSVRGNATQIHQVLMNLCVNARDAMPDGGTLTFAAENVVLDEIRARTLPDARPGPYVLLTVGDTGTGMAPEVLDHVFEPFYTTKAPGQGTGLGLSTSLGIVKSHGGFIDVESAPGRGTRMQVFLPANQEVVEPRSVSEAPFVPRGEGEQILVVDDELTIREVTQIALEAHGYTVQVAGDGREAEALFAAKPTQFRLVITDMMMPNMDGPATIRAIRQLNPAVSIIAVSGLTAYQNSSSAADVGPVTVLLKPYTVEKLLDAVGTILGRGEHTK